MPLFVGGVADGDWREPKFDDLYYSVRESPKLSALPYPPETRLSDLTIKQSNYHRILFNCGKETYTVWAEETMQADKVFELLMQYYSPPQGADDAKAGGDAAMGRDGA
jgi:hypothetical protein